MLKDEKMNAKIWNVHWCYQEHVVFLHLGYRSSYIKDEKKNKQKRNQTIYEHCNQQFALWFCVYVLFLFKAVFSFVKLVFRTYQNSSQKCLKNFNFD